MGKSHWTIFSFKFTKQVNNFPTPNLPREGQLSGLSGQESKVFLWGDGHISPIELPGADGFISKISIGGGTRAGLTNQNTLVIWECVISPDGLPDYKSRRLSDFKIQIDIGWFGIHRSNNSEGSFGHRKSTKLRNWNCRIAAWFRLSYMCCQWQDSLCSIDGRYMNMNHIIWLINYES